MVLSAKLTFPECRSVAEARFTSRLCDHERREAESRARHDISHSSAHAPEMKPEQKQEQAVTPQREIAPQQEQSYDIGLGL
jgi:hypothetical protein